MPSPFACGQRCGEVTPVREHAGARGSACEPASLLTSHHLEPRLHPGPTPTPTPTTSPSQPPHARPADRR